MTSNLIISQSLLLLIPMHLGESFNMNLGVFRVSVNSIDPLSSWGSLGPAIVQVTWVFYGFLIIFFWLYFKLWQLLIELLFLSLLLIPS